MIKAHELRINNIVTDEFYETFRTTIVVESINEKGINLSVQNSDDFPEMQDHWIEPDYEFDKLRGIPITSEWLYRFGLYWDIYWQGITDGNWVLTEGHEKGTWRISYGKTRHDIIVWNIKYVHQLQNLYHCLSGKELQLKDKTV